MYFSGGTGSGLSLVVAMPACSDASAVDDTTGADDLDADDTTGADVLNAFGAFGFSRDPLPEPEMGLNARVSDVNLRRAERWRDASGVREQNKRTLCQSLEGSLPVTPLQCHYTGRAFNLQIDHHLYPVSQNNMWPVPDASKHISERAHCQAHLSIEQTMHAPFSDLRSPATKGFCGQMTQR